MPTHRCPAMLMAAPASGHGKTTVTAALARYHRNQGRRVRVFKTGPDFLDPMILARASGAPVENLDLWMVGEALCARHLAEAAAQSDLIIIEGVMGLFDGTPSAADLAQRFGVPVGLVIDAGAMAQTFAAIAWGLARFRPELRIAGIIANRVAGDYHAGLAKALLPEALPWWGALQRDEAIELPSRHLGLVQAGELADLDARLDAAAARIAAAGLTALPPAVAFTAPAAEPLAPLLDSTRIAVATDAAFAFVYAANLTTLTGMGAEIVAFSPLAGDRLPPCDAVYLPGGYPELHLDALAGNSGLIDDLRAHHLAGRPIYAECGGMLYLCETLTDHAGRRRELVGLLPAEAQMTTGLRGLGMQAMHLDAGELRGHSFHHSRLDTDLPPATLTQRPESDRPGEAVYRLGRLTASYFHGYFPSAPSAVAALFGGQSR